MIGSLDEMCLRRRGQVHLDDVRVPPIGCYSIVFGLPELDRRRNRGETGGGKGVAGGGSGHDRRLDALVMDPNRAGGSPLGPRAATCSRRRWHPHSSGCSRQSSARRASSGLPPIATSTVNPPAEWP